MHSTQSTTTIGKAGTDIRCGEVLVWVMSEGGVLFPASLQRPQDPKPNLKPCVGRVLDEDKRALPAPRDDKEDEDA